MYISPIIIKNASCSSASPAEFICSLLLVFLCISQIYRNLKK